MAEDRAEWEGKVFVSEPFSRLPPLATTSCIIEDNGKHNNIAVDNKQCTAIVNGIRSVYIHANVLHNE